MTARPHMPLSVKLEAAIRQLGLDPECVEFDHHPALALRARQPDGSYDPPANDPRYIVVRSRPDHRTKTSGRKGEKRSTSYGSDQHAIAKVRRINKEPDKWRDILAPKRETERAKRRIPSRPFSRGRRPFPKRASNP